MARHGEAYMDMGGVIEGVWDKARHVGDGAIWWDSVRRSGGTWWDDKRDMMRYVMKYGGAHVEVLFHNVGKWGKMGDGRSGQ